MLIFPYESLPICFNLGCVVYFKLLLIYSYSYLYVPSPYCFWSYFYYFCFLVLYLLNPKIFLFSHFNIFTLHLFSFVFLSPSFWPFHHLILSSSRHLIFLFSFRLLEHLSIRFHRLVILLHILRFSSFYHFLYHLSPSSSHFLLVSSFSCLHVLSSYCLLVLWAW